jgi:hypothetical protein
MAMSVGLLPTTVRKRQLELEVCGHSSKKQSHEPTYCHIQESDAKALTHTSCVEAADHFHQARETESICIECRN